MQSTVEPQNSVYRQVLGHYFSQFCLVKLNVIRETVLAVTRMIIPLKGLTLNLLVPTYTQQRIPSRKNIYQESAKLTSI